MKNVISTYVERWNTLLGVIFVVVIMFMPYGLVPGGVQRGRRLRNRGQPRKAASTAKSYWCSIFTLTGSLWQHKQCQGRVRRERLNISKA